MTMNLNIIDIINQIFLRFPKCLGGTFSSYARSISAILSPVVSGTIYQLIAKSNTLNPAKMKPVFAPRLPESILYM